LSRVPGSEYLGPRCMYRVASHKIMVGESDLSPLCMFTMYYVRVYKIIQVFGRQAVSTLHFGGNGLFGGLWSSSLYPPCLHMWCMQVICNTCGQSSNAGYRAWSAVRQSFSLFVSSFIISHDLSLSERGTPRSIMKPPLPSMCERT